jgi:hypothetical protein
MVEQAVNPEYQQLRGSVQKLQKDLEKIREKTAQPPNIGGGPGAGMNRGGALNSNGSK